MFVHHDLEPAGELGPAILCTVIIHTGTLLCFTAT